MVSDGCLKYPQHILLASKLSRKEKKRKKQEKKRKENKRKENTTPFGVNLMRSQVLNRAARVPT